MANKGTTVALVTATYLRNTLAMQWRVHVKICGKCIVTGAAKRCYGDKGWERVKELQLARASVAELEQDLAAEQPTLF